MNRGNYITITGHKGILGSQLMKLLSPEHEIQGLDLPENDLTDLKSARRAVLKFEPDIIFHTAAYTDVDGAESDIEKAFLVNSLATRNLALTAAEIDIPIVYFSTDFVFCGCNYSAPINEFQPAAPKGVYALSKWGGEEEIRRYQPKHYIIRTSWLYGAGGKNFVDTICKLASQRDSLNVINDQKGTPTFAADLAEETIRLADFAPYGTYHISGIGSCSWYEFAWEIVKLTGLHCKIYPISTWEYNSAAPRPAYSALDHLCLRNTIGDNMPHWRDSLKKYLEQTNRLK
ncbi:dTDP-4-dehydrorhamnose reductase [bacterium]|nr:dTDP-4-dehydrorhamnose reductase [bacterium]